MATARSRSRDRAFILAGAGSKQTYKDGSPYLNPSFSPLKATDHEDCSDYLDSKPYGDHPLTMSRRICKPTTVSGERTIVVLPYLLTERFTNWTAERYAYYGWAPSMSTFDFDLLETKMFKSLNPNKPIVDIPVFLWELREFPRMLKQLGDVLLKHKKPGDVPGGHLAYEMGWKPLVSDLMKLGDIANSMKKEAEFHESLRRGRKVQRTVYRETLHESFAGTLTSLAPGLVLGRSIRRDFRGWFSARVRLKDGYPFDPRSSAYDKIVNALGLRIDAATIWNSIPWTWLIDYFINIGDVLEANRGVFPYEFSHVNLMLKEVATEDLYTISNLWGYQVSHGGWRSIYKRRAVVANPGLKFALMPALSGRQKAILGSLVLAKALKGPLGGVR
jgi:hypothetical protein